MKAQPQPTFAQACFAIIVGVVIASVMFWAFVNS